MPTTTRPPVAAFADEAQAQNAMNDLQRAGFAPNQIRYSVRRGGGDLTNSLEQLGLEEPEASFFNHEFEAGRTVVMVLTDDRQAEASEILRRNGGYDSSSQATQ